MIEELIYLHGIFVMNGIYAEIISHRPNEPLIHPFTVFFTVSVKPEIEVKIPINKKFKRFLSAVLRIKVDMINQIPSKPIIFFCTILFKPICIVNYIYQLECRKLEAS